MEDEQGSQAPTAECQVINLLSAGAGILSPPPRTEQNTSLPKTSKENTTVNRELRHISRLVSESVSICAAQRNVAFSVLCNSLRLTIFIRSDPITVGPLCSDIIGIM